MLTCIKHPMRQEKKKRNKLHWFWWHFWWLIKWVNEYHSFGVSDFFVRTNGTIEILIDDENTKVGDEDVNGGDEDANDGYFNME